LQTWGSYADIAQGEAPGGTFNEPWGIALGPDGSVYVADVWNHRIQKFTAKGEFVTMWGFFGQAETPEAFWGPRDVAVDDQGRVFVTDTGNKRVVVFDANGNYITQFGQTGMALGDFDEPVGIALGPEGNIYIADTWNQRIQVFTETDTDVFAAQNTWDVNAWYGQSQDNKPYLAVDQQGNVFATDPEGYRVLEFTSQGEAVRFWGDFGTQLNRFGLAGAVAVDGEGGVWVTDTGNSRLMHFTLP
jgi:DNA-binding beta-propeller fold protein YncE